LTVTVQSPEPDPATTLDPEDELEPAVAVLDERPSLERTVTDGPGPVVEPVTPPGPAVTELDIVPPGFGPPCWTTVQGCPVEVVPVVVPEPAETELDVP
jgi:hypothetical protein